jgi:hypothetical protein
VKFPFGSGRSPQRVANAALHSSQNQRRPRLIWAAQTLIALLILKSVKMNHPSILHQLAPEKVLVLEK